MSREEKLDFFGRRPSKFWRTMKDVVLVCSIILGIASIFTIILFEKIGVGIIICAVFLIMVVIYLMIDDRFY